MDTGKIYNYVMIVGNITKSQVVASIADHTASLGIVAK